MCYRYGVFFLEWYSRALVKHAGDVLDAVLPAMNSVKVNGNSAPVRLKTDGILLYFTVLETLQVLGVCIGLS